ncbi:hypothetical protein [Luteimonas aquatica]|uniref:hypothetical protein n=1 Tax=Luteimonas aquatica TaxID=450364 RepID=UPI001F570BBF|nr:hypothetical protein [Luteimonas aquatica]
MKHLKKLSVIACLCLASTMAHAGSYQGYVTQIIPSTSNGMAHIILSNGAFQPGFPSSCPHENNQMIYSIDLSTATGKALFDAALSAKENGTLTYVYGNGSCAPRAPVPPTGNTEVVVYLGIK